MRIIFAGTTNFSASYLNALLLYPNYQIIAVLTQKHFPAAYEKLIYTKNIQAIAKKYKLPIFQPKSLYTNKITNTIKNLHPDIIIIIAYGLIIPKKILNLPPLGCINVHASLLPRWRGAAPIQRALEAGDTKTGITIIKMDTGIDTGNILHTSICDILPHDTSLTIFNKLINIGITALLKTLSQIKKKLYYATPQDNKFSTYAKKINKHEGKINWELSAVQLERKIRAFNPWPTSYFEIHGKRIKIWKAKINKIQNIKKKIKAGTILSTKKSELIIATNHESLSILLIQEEGKRIMPINEFLNSKKHWFTPGSILNN